MSDEGVLGNLEEINGESKILNGAGCLTVDNSDSVNSSFFIMGRSRDEIPTSDGSVNFFYKQVGTTLDEHAVILNDFKSVEEWLMRSKSDTVSSVDFDTLKSEDLITFNTLDSCVKSGTECNSLPHLSSFLSQDVGESKTNNVVGGLHLNWEDLNLVLDTDSLIDSTSSTNILSGVGPPSTLKPNQERDSAVHRIDGFLPSVTVLNSPTTLTLQNDKVLNIPKPHDEKKQFGLGLAPSLGLDSPELMPKLTSKKLPFIKIPKHCLVKGKILGRPNRATFLGKNCVSFLNPPNLGLNNTKVVVPSDKNQNQNKEPFIIKKKRRSIVPCQGFLNVDGKPAIVVLPVNSIRKVSKNSLLKKNQPEAGNSIKHVNNDSSVETLTQRTINMTHNTPKKMVPYAVVAISTDKTKDSTEIIINPGVGQNVYKGKTSDLMKSSQSSLNKENGESTSIVAPAGGKSKLTPVAEKLQGEVAIINDILKKLVGVTEDVLDKIEGSETTFQLKCPLEKCKFVTNKGIELKTHIISTHYKMRSYKCHFPDCSWTFFTNFRLKRHMEVHGRRKEYLCPVYGCGRSFSTTYNVNHHLKLHDRPTTVKCEINGCDRAFQTRKGYEKHLREHGPDYAPYTCQKNGCGKKYYTVNSLNSHSRIHQHTEEDLKCSYCGRMFDQPCRLKAHINTHTGHKPYKCDYEGCKWSFTTSSKLRRHQRKHTQVRKHQCKICKKSFLRSEHLRDHSLKHFVKKSFICPIADCGTTFANKSTMYSHLKKHRNQEIKAGENLTFPCPADHCDVAFTTKESLRLHLLSSHASSGLADNLLDAVNFISEDNYIAFDSSSAGPGMVSFNTTSQDGLMVGMSDFVQCIPAMEQVEYDSNSSNIITHVVFTDGEDQDESASQEIASADDTVEESSGSARTGITYQDATEGKRRMSESLSELGSESLSMGLSGTDSLPAGLHSASDVVLSAGLLSSQDMLLQDELSGGDLYSMGASSSEEVGLLGPTGELQVLLLDPSSRLQHSDFEQSTINLRDLE